jgi:glutathione S-transferase
MVYDLAIGDRGYSSWSLRGWLLLDAFGIPVKSHTARLYTDELAKLLKGYAPARTVPALRTPQGIVVYDTLAMAEELATLHPEAGHWPSVAQARATARSLAAEMHSSFSALRNHCPMNLRVSYSDCQATEAVLTDLARIEHIWAQARQMTSPKGPWLCGEYSAADAFFAPVAARIAGYNLPVGTAAMAYVQAHLAHPSFRCWRAMGLVDGADQPNYFRSYPLRDWPGPKVLAAKAVNNGPSVNATCPYSGDPVTHFMEMGGNVWGFCNAFCRDKTVADPEAWPKFMAIYQS